MSNRVTGIKNWAEDDRPREKLLQKGIHTLSDAELIAILLGSGNKEESAVDLAKRVLSSAKYSLNELGRMSVADLQKFKGIGEAKAVTVAAAMELGRRRKASEIIKKQQITSSKDAFEIFSALLADLPHEEFWGLYLNQANKIIEKVKISSGGVAQTIIDVKMVMKPAVEKLASAMLVCHNHPSGSLQPSASDVNLTEQIAQAGELMNVKLLDHIIVSDNGYYSFADEGML